MLCVDDFGIKYTNKQDLDHLHQALKHKYNIKEDLTGNLYCGISLKWDYNKRTVKLSMPNYVKHALHKFQHSPPTRKQQAPHPWIPKVFGKQIQLVNEPLPSPPLSKQSTTRIQQIVGTFLYYARAIDDTILVALNSISTMQSKPTLDTLRKVNHLLDYLATNPDYEVTYKSSNMILHVDSDAAYLVEPGAKSRAGGYFYFSNHINPKLNGPIYCLSTLIKAVMSSAAEAELGDLFLNATNVVSIRNTLHDMNHPQPPTPIKTDNTTALGVITNTIKRKRTKAMDMRFHWVSDRMNQKQLRVYWGPGRENEGDYFTKHHPPSHHKSRRHNQLLNILTTFKSPYTSLCSQF